MGFREQILVYGYCFFKVLIFMQVCKFVVNIIDGYQIGNEVVDGERFVMSLVFFFVIISFIEICLVIFIKQFDKIQMMDVVVD